MRTRTINFKNKSSVFWKYFTENTTDTRCMRNTANFYIRNTMTGIRKSPEERTPLETEVLHDVFTGIQKANREAEERFLSKCDSLRKIGGMKSAVRRSRLVQTVFSYPTKDKWFLNYETLDAIFKGTDHPVYRRMNSQVNQNAIRKTVKSWVGYFESMKEYAVCPEKFLGRPKLPGYIRTQQATAWWTKQTARFTFQAGKAYLQFVNLKEMFCIGKESQYRGLKYIKTEIKPFHGQFRILITLDDHIKEPELPEDPKRILGIDPGLDNLLTVAGNFGKAPFVIRGGVVKSINQRFNKRRAKLIASLTRGYDSSHSHKDSHALDALSRKREDALRDIFYKCAWYLVRYAKVHKVEVIVVGYNPLQKQEISMGKQNNQSFVSIPFQKLREIIRMIANREGIPIVMQDESYTSTASCLDQDPVPDYKKGEVPPEFSGKRTRRGLYRSANGILINADVNGAANIIRKRYPDAFKGQRMDYLYRTTETVNIQDWYLPYRERRNLRKHTCSKISRIRHGDRSERRADLMKAFGCTRKAWMSVKTAA
ncbi:RNA-guided endonuclease InsQ/TnpB family protein [Coprococcus comes]|uniref:RNA-guided endonuclease InsQ/TnpB family protein n=1 Tax=Coprococcus comes TaxID=410072 RepID=UPI001897E6CD|nr:RNA-guided endonuclease TnpB family protein [Coprococcus comes]